MLTTDRVVVVDGHDGCGKSSLSPHVARLIGGVVVKPFGDTLGDHIAWLWQEKRFEEADALARSSVERLLQRRRGPLVFDRHWATMFTVLPEHLWPAWGELPPTVICTASPGTVATRLLDRGEDVGDLEQHAYYLNRYLEVAGQCGRHLVVDTEKYGIDESVSRIVAFLCGDG